MHAVLVGCGRVGAELAKALEDRGYTVAIIDKNPAEFEKRLHPGFNGKKVAGLGFDKDTLEEAGIEEAELFASVTRGDNSNIVSARIAKEHYGVKNVAALIYDPRRVEIYERVGISTVAAVGWMTDQMLARLLPASESVEWTVGDGDVVVAGVQAPDSLIGQSIGSLEDPGKVTMVAVTRLGVTEIPDKGALIQEGDFLHLSILKSALPEFDERLKATKDSERR